MLNLSSRNILFMELLNNGKYRHTGTLPLKSGLLDHNRPI